MSVFGAATANWMLDNFQSRRKIVPIIDSSGNISESVEAEFISVPVNKYNFFPDMDDMNVYSLAYNFRNEAELPYMYDALRHAFNDPNGELITPVNLAPGNYDIYFRTSRLREIAGREVNGPVKG